MNRCDHYTYYEVCIYILNERVLDLNFDWLSGTIVNYEARRVFITDVNRPETDRYYAQVRPSADVCGNIKTMLVFSPVTSFYIYSRFRIQTKNHAQHT